MVYRADWSRRDVLGSGLAGAGWVILGGFPTFALGDDVDQLAGKTLNLVLRYRTDPDRVARVLPPGLEPDDAAEVTIDWWLLYPERGGENLFFPGPYTESGIHVTARYQGHRGMFQLGMPLDQDWGRAAGRENVGLLKKDGVLRLRRDGRVVRADLVRRGKLLYRVETVVLDRPAHPLFWHRETGFGAFLYRYRLHPDWREGPLGDDPVELWLRVLGGKRGVYPTEMTAGAPRECDAARTRFQMVEPSLLDPFAELPLREIVGVSYRETGLVPDADRAHREARTESRIERLQLVDRERFEPWALYAYDRPITASVPWTPAGWPRRTTAWKLDAGELERYRRRDALSFEVRATLDVRLAVDPEVHRRTLPPGLDAGAKPMMRILALDLGANDLSTEPFRELWLFAGCAHAGAESWYALSHLVGANGDVVFGRETFGYPSRIAAIEWALGGTALEVTASRLGRTVVRLAAPREDADAAGVAGDAGDAGDPRDAEDVGGVAVVIGLRLHPPYRVMTERGFVEPGPRADLVAQSWTLEPTVRRSVAAARVRLELPADAGPGRIGKPDPWYELAGSEVVAAFAAGGVLRRGPGRDLGPLAGWEPYYRERFDGAMEAGEATSGRAPHTFLAG